MLVSKYIAIFGIFVLFSCMGTVQPVNARQTTLPPELEVKPEIPA